MFAKPKQEPQRAQAAKPKVKLTNAEKREIRRILENAKGDGKARTAQDTLPFRQMYPDGLCRLDEKSWSRCIEFEDVNYQLAKPADQTAIFESLCDMYNAHDASIGLELSLVSHRMNREEFVKRIEIAAQNDRFDRIRECYTQMLRGQLEHGNNGLIKTKYLVLTIEAKDIKTARARFSRMSTLWISTSITARTTTRLPLNQISFCPSASLRQAEETGWSRCKRHSLTGLCVPCTVRIWQTPDRKQCRFWRTFTTRSDGSRSPRHRGSPPPWSSMCTVRSTCSITERTWISITALYASISRSWASN